MISSVNLPDTCSNYYELLGLPPFEADANVINAKVRERMREARKYQVGQYAAQAERHLNLLGTATACLTNPQQKQTYDNELREQWGLPPVTVVTSFTGSASPAADRNPGTGRRLRPVAFIALAAAMMLMVGLMIGLSGNGASEHVKPASTEVPASEVAQTTTPAVSTPKGENKSTLPTTNSTAQISHELPHQDSQRRTKEDVGSTQSPPPESGSLASAAPERPEDRQPGPAVASKPTARDLESTDQVPEKSETAKPSGGSPTGRSVNPLDALPGRTSASRTPSLLEFDLSPDEVIRELKNLRVKRAAIGESAGRQALRLVRYGQAAFPDDRRFLRQLQVEITALRKVFPQLQDSLKNIPR